MKKIAIILLVAFSLAGCGMKNDLPFSQSVRKTNIKHVKTVPGKTTKEEIENILGSPDKQEHQIYSNGTRIDTYEYMPLHGWYSIELESCKKNDPNDCVTYMRNAKEHYFTFANGVLESEPYTITRGSDYDMND